MQTSLSTGDHTRRVSIITVVYNGASYLEKTIQSVLSQDYPNMEYVVIDGGSTDGTLHIIERYRAHIDYFVSEPDKGIYDAINKGIAQCTGDVIKIQNADDILLPGSVRAAMKHLGKLPASEPVILIGQSEVLDATGAVVGRITDRAVFLGFESFNHPSWYVTSELYRRLGGYSLKYRIASDFEYYLRAKKHGSRILRVPALLAGYRKGGASSGFRGVREVMSILREYKGAGTALLVGSQLFAGKLLQRAKVTLVKSSGGGQL
jgi:glycosyltransferase involved in cell wall biosynthesis